MKIIFIGTVEFSLKTLQRLITMGSEIVGVCTKEMSTFNSDFADLVPICKENNIPYKYIEDINSKESIEWMKALNPEIIFCFGWSSLIKKELLDLAEMGIIGYHPAKLPENRGRHPLIWALSLGLKESASTFFFMKEGVDDGDILSQRDFDILVDDDAQILYNKVVDTAILQIEEFVPMLENKTFQRVQQDEKKRNIWRKRGNKDGKIDFRMNSKAIYNLVRALAKPYGGAHLSYNNQDVVIWKVEIIEYFHPNIESGKILESNDKFIVVKTYDGAVKIIEHGFKILPKYGEYL